MTQCPHVKKGQGLEKANREPEIEIYIFIYSVTWGNLWEDLTEGNLSLESFLGGVF